MGLQWPEGHGDVGYCGFRHSCRQEWLLVWVCDQVESMVPSILNFFIFVLDSDMAS